MKEHPRKVLSLSPLYDFVSKHGSVGDDALRLRGTRVGTEYCRLCDEITKPVDEEPGFYLWGRYDCKRYWHSIYLGTAGYKRDKTSLRRRITEELKDERAFVWRFVYSEADVLEVCRRIHGGKYTWRRPIRKVAATEIIWIPGPGLSDSRIRMIEADLIEALSPSANLVRPAPVRNVQDDAARIFAQFREIIHRNRPDKPSKLQRRVERRFGANLPVLGEDSSEYVTTAH
jgi:hypothetical protein